MKSAILFIVLIFGVNSYVSAQSKKDLLTEIDKLRTELSATKTALNESKTKETINRAKVESMEVQMKNLEETNTSILSKMGGFTQLSQQKSKNLEQSLETIKKKDIQLNTINQELTKADSTKLAIFAVFKNGLGDSLDKEVKMNVSGGAIYLTMDNEFLFGTGSSSAINESAKGALSKIGNVLNAKSDLTIQVIGNSNELSFANGLLDNWDLSSLQASAVARALQTEYSVEPKRIEVVGKGQYSTEAVDTFTRIMISPKHEEFFVMVKESMKN